MDIENFAATPETIAGFQKTKATRKTRVAIRKDVPRHGSGDKFIKGPIPLDWIRAASRCGRRSTCLAILLWYAAGCQRTNPIKLGPSILSELAIAPKTASRILERMHSMRIVSVEFHRGRSPLVTILALPSHDGQPS
jgi:hypothetical protein